VSLHVYSVLSIGIKSKTRTIAANSR